MKPAIAAALLLFPASAMAGTFVYTPVHVAPVVHVAPMVHVAPTVHVAPVVRVNPGSVRTAPNVRSAPTGGRLMTHSHPNIRPVTVVTAIPNPKKCIDPKSGKECQKK